jgi:nitroreductase
MALMELREAITRRYAAKHFDGRAIPEEKVRELLESARWVPSGLNIQPWRVKVVSAPCIGRELSGATYDLGCGQSQASEDSRDGRVR